LFFEENGEKKGEAENVVGLRCEKEA